MWKTGLSRENRLALAVCVAVLLLIIVTAESAPPFIYSGF
jgi:hypothetical protein